LGKIGQNWQIWQKNAKIVENWPKLTKTDQNWSKWGVSYRLYGVSGGGPLDPPRDPPYLRASLKKKKNFCAVYRYLCWDRLLTQPNGLKKRLFSGFRGFCWFLGRFPKMRKNAKIEGFGAKPSILAFLLIFGSGGSNLGVRGHFLAPGPQFWGSEGTFWPSDPNLRVRGHFLTFEPNYLSTFGFLSKNFWNFLLSEWVHVIKVSERLKIDNHMRF